MAFASIVVLSFLGVWLFYVGLTHIFYPMVISWSSSSNPLKVYPPGPRPLYFLGNIISFSEILRDPGKQLKKIASKYKETCIFWIGERPVLLINHPLVAIDLLEKVFTPYTSRINDLFRQRGAIYSSRSNVGEFAKYFPGRLLTTPYGKEFRYLRKLYNDILSVQGSARIRRYQRFESIAMFNAIIDYPETFFEHTERYTASVIFSACYGVRFPQADHPILNVLYSCINDVLRCKSCARHSLYDVLIYRL
jgi:hypothetical protein